MKRLFIISILILSPLVASATCFKIDVSTLNRSNASDFIADVLSTVDYSQCSVNELNVASDGLKSFGPNQAKQMQSNDWATKSSAASYVALAKSSLALIQNELEKRK